MVDRGMLIGVVLSSTSPIKELSLYLASLLRSIVISFPNSVVKVSFSLSYS